MQIRDRIVEFIRLPASELAPSPRNWRTHPEAQRRALRGVLAEIGFASAIVARRRDDDRLEIIDGHLRAETTPDQLVPVLVLDVTEEEADKLLLTFDPLSAMAQRDEEKFAALSASVSPRDPAVQKLIAEVQRVGAAAPPRGPAARASVEVDEAFHVLVECDDELQQCALYQRLTQEGFDCRLMML